MNGFSNVGGMLLMNNKTDDSSYNTNKIEWNAFSSSPLVLRMRNQQEFISCPICSSNEELYLFHSHSGRHVKCANCHFIFINPISTSSPSPRILSADLINRLPIKKSLLSEEILELIQRSQKEFFIAHGHYPSRTVFLGPTIPELQKKISETFFNVQVPKISDEKIISLLWQGDAQPIRKFIEDADLIILKDFLDHSLRPDCVLRSIFSIVNDGAWLAVVYRDNAGKIARLLRKYWKEYVTSRTSFFSRNNIIDLAQRIGAQQRKSFTVWSQQTLSTAIHRFSQRIAFVRIFRILDFITFKIPIGMSVTLMEKTYNKKEKLSIVVPIFNEQRYVKKVLGALFSIKLDIDIEFIIVESNSTDGTRDIVKTFENIPNVKLIFENSPKGKGHAVRAGLKEATGSIVLIQDSDFEYDLDDYPSLLKPILARHTEFVLGSRSLGLEGWKVRQYSNTPIKGLLMNFAQIIFAKTYNILFRQSTTDINTMFKVFRTSCLKRFELKSNGFELDIELVCKLALAGYKAYEVPVNYRSRGFEDGKKIRFFHDAFHSYLMIFRCRFFNF